MIHLADQRPAAADQHHAGRRLEQDPVFLRQMSGFPEKNAAGLVNQSVRVAAAAQVHQVLLQLLKIARRVFIQNDKVHLETFQPPIRMSSEELLHQGHLGHLGDAHQHDRLVAGDSKSPQSGKSLLVGGQNAGRSAMSAAGVDHVRRQPLVEV